MFFDQTISLLELINKRGDRATKDFLYSEAKNVAAGLKDNLLLMITRIKGKLKV